MSWNNDFCGKLEPYKPFHHFVEHFVNVYTVIKKQMFRSAELEVPLLFPND